MMSATTRRNRELRTKLNGPISYVSGCGDGGHATWVNVSRAGAAILLGRYLRPGRRIDLMVAPGSDENTFIGAEIAWCVPVPGTLQFKAGLRMVRQDPESALQFAKLGYAAQAQNKFSSKTVSNAVWTSLQSAPNTLPNTGVSKLTQAV
jgi:hypothetical protein